MKLLVNDQHAGSRIAELANCRYVHGSDVCFSTHRSDGTFLGGTILTDYTGAAMTLHEGSVSEHWLTRDMLWVTFHYPFVQLGCRSVIGTTPRSNTHALAFALKIGFEIETMIRDCLPGGDDMVITRMWRDRCKWLRIKPRMLRDGAQMMGVA